MIVCVAGNLFSSGINPNNKQVNSYGAHAHSVGELSRKQCTPTLPNRIDLATGNIE